MKQLPNILTISRVAIIPVIIILFLIPSDMAIVLAGVLFIIAAITDYFDGYFARSMHIVSSFGRFLDPIADKLLVVASLFMIAATQGDSYYGARFFGSNALFAIPAMIILCREIIVSGLREYLAELKVGIPVTRLAKWKTGFQMTAIPFMIFGFLFLPFAYIGTVLLWISAVLTIITGWDYLKAGLQYMNIEPEVMLTPIKKVINAKDTLVDKMKEASKDKKLPSESDLDNHDEAENNLDKTDTDETTKEKTEEKKKVEVGSKDADTKVEENTSHDAGDKQNTTSKVGKKKK